MRMIHLTIGKHVGVFADAFTDTTHASKMIGRLLLGLVAFLMVAMMWTERFLTWDKFLQGGQDLELSLVALVVFLCLIILLAQRSQQAVAFQLAVFRFFSGLADCFLRAQLMPMHLTTGRKPDEVLDRLTGSSSGACLSPLRI